ncbi:hypothetical protein PSPHG_CDS_0161 [Pseudomonas phage Psxphi15]
MDRRYEVKKIEVSFVKVSDPKIKSGATVLVEDDVDKYDVMTHFEKTADFGWIITSVEVKETGIKIEQLYPREY